MLNGTGKVGVAAYWKRFLQGKGFTNVVMADYKGEINDHTVVLCDSRWKCTERRI